jgi:hypothetical protein
MPSLIWNPVEKSYFGNSTDDIPNGLRAGDKAFFFDEEKHKIFNGTAFVDNIINTNSVFEVSDLQIGAVEIKNATNDTRATVGSNGLYVDVQNIKAGSVIGIDQTTPGTTNKTTNDITHIAATPLTGADWTEIFQSLNDVSKTGLLKSFGDISSGESFITKFGNRDDLAQTDPTQTASFIAYIKGIASILNLIKNTDGIKKITDALPDGTNIIGKVGIDQTSDGVTNKVQARNDLHDAFNSNANMQINNNDVSISNPAPIIGVGDYINGTQIGVDQTLTWANSDVVNTTKTITFTKSVNNKKEHEIIIANQSTASALSVDIGNIEPNIGFTNNTDSLKSVLTTINVPASTAIVIEDCEDAWNEQVVTNVTVTADGTIKQVGTNSAKIAIGEDVTANTIVASKAISSTNLSQYTHIYAWIYSDVALDAGDFQLLLDNTANCVSPIEILNIPAISATTWTRVRIPLVNPDQDTAIISIGLKMVIDKGACNIYIDDVNAVKMSVVSTPVQAWKNNVDGFIRASNATALTSVQGFNAKIRVKEI